MGDRLADDVAERAVTEEEPQSPKSPTRMHGPTPSMALWGEKAATGQVMFLSLGTG